MLQLVYLYFTNIAKDQKSYDNLMETKAVALKNRLLQPESVFGDSLQMTMTAHNPRSVSLKVEDLANVDYDRILQMAKH